MHKIIIILAIVFINTSCGQSKKEDIAKNQTYKMLENLRNFKYEPIYQLRVETIYNYEVRINDIVVLRKFNDYANNNVININQAIIDSDKQNVQINIFPRYISKEQQNEYLEQGISFYLTIEETSWQDGSLVEPNTIVEYELSELDKNNQKIDFTKMLTFNDNTSFKAEVPYTLKSWKDSKVFKPEDIEKLTPKALLFYKKIKKLFDSQQGEKYMGLLGKGYYNLAQASYFDSIKSKNHFNKRIDAINKNRIPLEPLENYKLEIMGNGRLLALVRTDGFNRGEGALRRYYMKNAFEMVNTDEILLHMPKGSDEFEVIWFMGFIKPAKS